MDAKKVPEKLRQNIIRSIQREEVRRVRILFALSLTAVGASALGIVVSVRYTMLAFSQSGFFSYVSLMFSDTYIVARYSREFAFSLIEALPLLAITFALVALVAFLVSIRMLATNARGDLTLSPA